MRALWAVLCIASLTPACGGDDDFQTGDGLPAVDASPQPDARQPDGGKPDAAAPIDAAEEIDAAPVIPSIKGAVCVVSDIRIPGDCGAIPIANAAGMIITVEGNASFSTVTNAAGEFTIPPATGLPYVTIVATDPSNTYHKAAVVFRPLPDGTGANVDLPMVINTRMTQLYTANGVTEDVNDGQFVVLVRAGIGADGALVTQATLAPIGDSEAYYDNVSANVFVQTGDTGARGWGVYFNAPPGLGTVAIKKGADTYTADYVVVKGAVTFMTLAFYDAT